MKLHVSTYELHGSVSNYLAIHPSTANTLDLEPGNLVKIDETSHGFQIITTPHIEQDCVGLSPYMVKQIGVNVGDSISFRPTGVEGVTRIIRKKMQQQPLSKEEIGIFMGAINNGLLTDGHIGAFGTAIEITVKEGRAFVFSSKNPKKICKIIASN